MTRVLVPCLAVAAFAVAAGAQDQRPPVFRGGVTFVNVDAYPRRDGRVVEGLRAEDFQVFEDGKPQKVETFEFVRTQPNAPDADRRDPNSQDESNQWAADPRNRLFVIYLDIYHTSFVGAHDAKQPLLNFLHRTIGATDLFGVLTPEVPVRQLVFGRRTDTVEMELTTHYDWGLAGRPVFPNNAEEGQLFACGMSGLIPLYREDRMASSLEELMVRLSVLRDERKNVLLISEGWVPRRLGRGASQSSGGGSIPRIGTNPNGRLGLDTPQGGFANQGWCERQESRLSSIDFEQRFRDLLTSASRANVSFYPVDVGGLKTNLPDASTPGIPTPGQTFGMLEAGTNRMATLQTLAENTDGRAIVNANGLDEGFRKIADDLSAYYLLGYSSTNAAMDGRFRRIEVKVSQPKVSVAARKGYLAPRADAMAAAAAAAATAVVVPPAITDELGRLARLRTDADLFSYGVASPSGLDVVTEIAGRHLEVGRWTKGAEVQVVATRPGAVGVTATGRIEPGVRGVLTHVPLPAGDVGPWRISVKLSGPDGTLDDRFDITATTDALLGAPLCFRGTSSARIALRPVADFLFRRTERAHIEWPVLKTLDQRTARVLDRKGQPLALGATVTESRRGDQPILAVDLSLAPLSEGDYLVELTAGQGAQTDRQVLALRIVR